MLKFVPLFLSTATISPLLLSWAKGSYSKNTSLKELKPTTILYTTNSRDAGNGLIGPVVHLPTWVVNSN
ncbi:hypothetical protein [Mycoplasma parvum]|uniref:Uncharacterized protein n=1 Tax=Mycoplasma parvum str. Indiana TaxID=1403316 RepID=U5NCI8_9MOLU|nr:hypothetical protein [Mycoplasma parvum]AGX89142.1 hypothetical protein PRV_02020 [Mycoplasma parvum str. Indiana]